MNTAYFDIGYFPVYMHKSKINNHFVVFPSTTTIMFLQYRPIPRTEVPSPVINTQKSENASAAMTIHSQSLTTSLPYQPHIDYPKDSDNRSFQYNWYKRWSWLDWDQLSGRVLCHPCRVVNQMGIRLLSKNADPTFSTSGFCTWKDAVRRFDKHAFSKAHMESVRKLQDHLKGVNVAAQLNQQLSSEHSQNYQALMHILSTLKFLCRQGLAIRGHVHSEGNFQELLCLRCEDNSELKSWLGRKSSFTSVEVQNECITLMAHHVLRKITRKIQEAQFFSIICDEVTDQSRQHQLGISARWVDSHFVVHEDFLELCLIPKGDADTLTKLITDSLLRLQLPIKQCRGQCYDGAAVMAGHVTGVSTRIADLEKRALFVHCLAHSLNLAVQESTRRVPLYRDLIEFIKDIINLIRASPKRSEIFAGLQNPANSSDQPTVPLGKHWTLRPLCPTRWTTRHQSMKSVLDNYVTVRETLQQVADTETTEAGTKANGLATVMQSFQFLFALRTAMTVFEATELLSKTVQSAAMTVTAASKAAEQTCLLLQRSREDRDWTKVWASVLSQAATFKIDDPVVPRLRRPPRRIDSGAPSTVMNPEQHFRVIFNEFLDNILGTIKTRFDQPALQLYCKIEGTILSAANGALSQMKLVKA
jgi:hypothetical protein